MVVTLGRGRKENDMGRRRRFYCDCLNKTKPVVLVSSPPTASLDPCEAEPIAVNPETGETWIWVQGTGWIPVVGEQLQSFAGSVQVAGNHAIPADAAGLQYNPNNYVSARWTNESDVPYILKTEIVFRESWTLIGNGSATVQHQISTQVTGGWGLNERNEMRTGKAAGAIERSADREVYFPAYFVAPGATAIVRARAVVNVVTPFEDGSQCLENLQINYVATPGTQRAFEPGPPDEGI